MIEVHVRNEHEVERREVFGVESRFDQTLRYLPDRVREYRIREHELVGNLNEHGRMSDPEHGELGVGPHGVLQLRLHLADVLETKLHRSHEETRQERRRTTPGGGEGERDDPRDARLQKNLTLKVPIQRASASAGTMLCSKPRNPNRK